MKKEDRQDIIKGAAAGALCMTVLAGALYLGKNYRLQNPFVRIDNNTNDDHIEREIPTWKEGTPYNYTNHGTDVVPEETQGAVTDDTTVEPIIGTPAYEETNAVYSYTDEELQAMFPTTVIDNSSHVLYESSVVISETPGQVTSMTSSISGGEVIKEEVTTTYEEVGYETGVSREQQQFICTEGGRFPRR